jgi:hypothetical protein
VITDPDPGGVARMGIHRSDGARALLVPWGTAGLLAAVAALHVIWAASPWPFATRAEFARTIVGVQVEQSPAPALCLLVAGALFAGTAVVLVGAGLLHIAVPNRFVRVGLWVLAGVLALRGVVGLLTSATDLTTAPWVYRHLDLMIYSPLCLLLAVGVAYTIRRSHR